MFAPSVHGPKKTGRSPFQRYLYVAETAAKGRIVAHAVKALEESVFGPCTLGANMGHPSRTFDLG